MSAIPKLEVSTYSNNGDCRVDTNIAETPSPSSLPDDEFINPFGESPEEFERRISDLAASRLARSRPGGARNHSSILSLEDFLNRYENGMPPINQRQD